MGLVCSIIKKKHFEIRNITSVLNHCLHSSKCTMTQQSYILFQGNSRPIRVYQGGAVACHALQLLVVFSLSSFCFIQFILSNCNSQKFNLFLQRCWVQTKWNVELAVNAFCKTWNKGGEWSCNIQAVDTRSSKNKTQKPNAVSHHFPFKTHCKMLKWLFVLAAMVFNWLLRWRSLNWCHKKLKIILKHARAADSIPLKTVSLRGFFNIAFVLLLS